MMIFLVSNPLTVEKDLDKQYFSRVVYNSYFQLKYKSGIENHVLFEKLSQTRCMNFCVLYSKTFPNIRDNWNLEP